MYSKIHFLCFKKLHYLRNFLYIFSIPVTSPYVILEIKETLKSVVMFGKQSNQIAYKYILILFSRKKTFIYQSSVKIGSLIWKKEGSLLRNKKR